MSDNTERVTIIEDDDFLDTDVSELVDGDYYLFHLTNDKMYIYKDGVVCVNNIDLQKEESHYCVPYTNGTLQDFIEGF
jgi:hypothetical protein